MSVSKDLRNFILNGPSTDSKQIYFGDLLPLMEFGQWDGLDYLYNVEPQSNNLFYAGFFCESEVQDGNYLKMFYNAEYRIKKIVIPFPSIDIEYHPETRVPMVKNVTYQNEITIDWFEDVYHSVQKYHLDWFNRWYSREYDCFRCGIQGKFRKMAVVAFRYKNNNETSIIPVPEIEPLFTFIIGGLIPKTMPAISFDYNVDGNDSLVSMQYNCGPIRWIYSNTEGMADDYPDEIDQLYDGSNISGNLLNKLKGITTTDVAKYGPKSQALSSPLESTIDYEKLRIMKSATYYQSTDGSL
jgi:hypothetical protein